MRFLCTSHKHKLNSYSEFQLTNMWIDWMDKGSCLYDIRQWRDAIPYIGCAFDLANDSLSYEHTVKHNAVTQVTLSAIYLSNAFHQIAEHYKAEYVLINATRRLQCLAADNDLQKWIDECINVIANSDRHLDFFGDFLQMPFQPTINDATMSVH